MDVPLKTIHLGVPPFQETPNYLTYILHETMLKWPMKKWGMALEGAADPDVPAPRPSKKKTPVRDG